MIKVFYFQPITLPEEHATEEGPPLKMIKLTAHHLGFDDDVFPPESKPKNFFATKSKPKTNERPSKPKSKNISARSSTANVKEKIIPEDEESVVVVPQKKKRPKRLRKKGKWGKVLKRGKDLAKQVQDEERRVFTGGKRISCRRRKKEKDTEEEEEKEEEKDIDEEENEEKKKEELGTKRKIEEKPILNRGRKNGFSCNQCGEIFETTAALEIHKVQEYC